MLCSTFVSWKTYAKAKVTEVYLSQESDSGGTVVPSQLGYHEAATTSESSENRDLEICRAFNGVWCANAKGRLASNRCRIFVIMIDREWKGRE